MEDSVCLWKFGSSNAPWAGQEVFKLLGYHLNRAGSSNIACHCSSLTATCAEAWGLLSNGSSAAAEAGAEFLVEFGCFQSKNLAGKIHQLGTVPTGILEAWARLSIREACRKGIGRVRDCFLRLRCAMHSSECSKSSASNLRDSTVLAPCCLVRAVVHRR